MGSQMADCLSFYGILLLDQSERVICVWFTLKKLNRVKWNIDHFKNKEINWPKMQLKIIPVIRIKTKEWQ